MSSLGNPTPTQEELAEMEKPTKNRFRDNAAWKRFRKNKLAVFGLVVLVFLILVALFAPLLAPYDPFISPKDELGSFQPYGEPSSEHILGTDGTGRDMLSRLIYGARISLSVALTAVLISTIIGVLLGVIAGYFGKVVDNIIMRITDVVISFPVLFLAITAAAILSPGIKNVIIIISLVSWTTMTRLVRGEVLKIREMEYVEAARSLGQSNHIIIGKHILPNIIAPIVVQATLQTAEAILTESALSFLGVGVQQPYPSWGNMLHDATSIMVLQFKPWIWVPAGFAILITILCINFLGDGLRDALDPKVK